MDSNYYLQSRTSLAIFIKISFSHFRATLRGKQSGSIEHQVIYPPNGVIPFHGFAMFCAPFCYVYDDTVQLYLCKFRNYTGCSTWIEWIAISSIWDTLYLSKYFLVGYDVHKISTFIYDLDVYKILTNGFYIFQLFEPFIFNSWVNYMKLVPIPKELLHFVLCLKIWWEICFLSHNFDLKKKCNFLFFLQLQTHEPDLWTHLMSNEVQPLRLVFRWMMRGFSGHLLPEQVTK